MPPLTMSSLVDEMRASEMLTPCVECRLLRLSRLRQALRRRVSGSTKRWRRSFGYSQSSAGSEPVAKCSIIGSGGRGTRLFFEQRPGRLHDTGAGARAGTCEPDRPGNAAGRRRHWPWGPRPDSALITPGSIGARDSGAGSLLPAATPPASMIAAQRPRLGDGRRWRTPPARKKTNNIGNKK